jgi:predicted Holliday junction resolvase-like endonuclease
LVVAIIVIAVLITKLTALSRDINGRATALFQQWKVTAETEIRRDAANRSQAVTIGKVSEQLAPYLPAFGFNPKDARFIGSPVDFLVFHGLSSGTEIEVVFVEVKSGTSVLTAKEKQVKQVREAVQARRVRWHEQRVPTGVLIS